MAAILNAASVVGASAATTTVVRKNQQQGASFRGGCVRLSSSSCRVGAAASSRAAKLSVTASASSDEENAAASVFGRRDLAKGALAALAAPALAAMPAGPAKAEEVSKFWELVDLPLEPGIILLDIAFADDKHGFLLGTRQTILETFDGGKTWDFKSIPAAFDEDVNYRFNSVSFKGQEGWIVGKPAILLHTTDGGATWERVGLSPRLPGAPVLITATSDSGQAEMVTDEGAIYLTTDAARNWKAAVEETISVGPHTHYSLPLPSFLFFPSSHRSFTSRSFTFLHVSSHSFTVLHSPSFTPHRVVFILYKNTAPHLMKRIVRLSSLPPHLP